MAAWLIYLRERFPLPVYLILVGGIALSGALLGTDSIRWIPIVISVVGLMMFFAVLRLMDEFKDFDKDKIAHPDRPLPRGILTVAQVSKVISMSVVAMALWSVATAFAANIVAGSSYLVVTAYLWLMYREFYCGTWLEQRPLSYAITHQLILLPLTYYTVVLLFPDSLTSTEPFNLSLVLIGSFFGYEVCRKLDPEAHPVLRTYLYTYGRARSFLIVVVAMVVAGYGAWLLNLSAILWPVESLLLLSMTLIWLRPGAFKIVEGMASFCLLAHVWVIPATSIWSSL